MNKKLIIALPLIFVFTILVLCFIWSRGKISVIFKNVPLPMTSTEYKVSILWPKNDGDKKVAGAGTGVAINSKGHIFYLQRAGYSYENKEIIKAATILELDSNTGKVLGEFGKSMFKSPHGLSIDSEDNIWVTDVMLNKVFKLNNKGAVLKTFGQDYPFYLETFLRIKNLLPQFPSSNNPYIFARPTDVVVNKKGEFIVTDGYRNKRLVKYDSDGKLIWQINKSGSGNGEFSLPHGLAIDNEDNLYVADRNNSRIQVFSTDGHWLKTWSSPELGRPYGLEVGKDQLLYVVDGGDLLNGKKTELHSQIIKMDLRGNIISRWGKYGSSLGELQIPHDIAVDESSNLYVAELNNNRLQKFKLKQK